MASLEGKNNPQHKAFLLRVILGDFLGLCRANVGPCWAVLGLCWAHVGSFDGLYGVPWGSLEGKNQPQRESLSVEVFFGDFLGLCRANVGPCWAMLGRFGSMLGRCWGHLVA